MFKQLFSHKSNQVIHPSFHLKRLFLAFIFLLSFACLLIYKFVHYQLVEYEEYHKQWAKQTTSKVKRKPQRGWIFDRNMQILAGNEETYRVFGEFDKLDDQKIQDLLEYLPSKLDISTEELKKKIDLKAKYTVLKKHVPKELALEIKQHFLK